MAVLSKIRERSLFLIIIIALALFSFVLSGLFDGSPSSKTSTEIGSINGEPIGRKEFAQQVDAYRSQANGRGNNTQFVNSAWNSLINDKIYEEQLEKSGVVVGEKDVWDALVAQISQQKDSRFTNEIGAFDPEKLKEYIATLHEGAEESNQGKAAWESWLTYENNVKKSLEKKIYNTLIKSGINTTLKEGEHEYYYDNTSVNIEYVYVPFETISDSLVKVSDNDIQNYVNQHTNDFKVEASRDIKLVHFDIKASSEDEENTKNEVAKMIHNHEEYSKSAKSNVNVIGFKEAINIAEFNAENDSDNAFDTSYYTKSKLAKNLIDNLFDKDSNEVYGPYKENGFYKLSKITATKQMPDSVKAAHILIPFAGSASADKTVTQNADEAKKIADSILKIIQLDVTKFEEIAKAESSDKGSGAKGGDLGWFTYSTMIPEFRDFVFENNVGDMGVVKSQFGFHIIKIDGQKNIQKNVQIATFSRKIEASEKTENEIFEKAETLTSEISSGKNIDELAKEKNYNVIPALNIEIFDDNFAQFRSQRQVVRWTFDENTNINDVKRFDTDNGYFVVVLTKINKAGISGRGKNVREIVLKEKKQAFIKERSTGSTLEDIAKENNTTKRTANAISNLSPSFGGQGRLVDIAGITTSLEENKLTKNIVGAKGVAFVKVLTINQPTALKNYNSNKKRLEKTAQLRSSKVYDAIKDNSKITDNRADFY